MNSLSDKELVGLAAKGDQEAFACLMERYGRFIRSGAAEKSKLCGCDFDDMYQEAAIGFLQAVNTYDPSKNTAFKTYAHTCVENMLTSAVRSYCSLKNRPLNNHEELDEADLSGSGVSGVPYSLSSDSGDPQNLLSESENFSALMDTVSLSLSDLEKNVLELRLSGLSYEETAARLNIDSKAVDNAVQRIRQKMKALMRSK